MARKNEVNDREKDKTIDDEHCDIGVLRECCDCNERNDLKLFSCFHSFCIDCIKTWKDEAEGNKRERERCPVCGDFTIIPGGDYTKLPDASSVVTDLDKAPSTCQLCDDDEATHVCKTCKQFICKRCYKSHKKLEATKHHEALLLKEWKSQSDKHLDMRSPGKCPEHAEEQLQFYCKKCEVPACNKCCVFSHQKHKLVELAPMAEKGMSKLKEAMTNVYFKLDLKESKTLELAQEMHEYEEMAEGKRREFSDKTQSHLEALEEDLVAKMRATTERYEEERNLLLQTEMDLNGLVDDLVKRQQSEVSQSTEFLQEKQEDLIKNVRALELEYRNGTMKDLLAFKKSQKGGFMKLLAEGVSMALEDQEASVEFPELPNYPNMKDRKAKCKRPCSHCTL